ncbi:dioxygenase [Microbacterium sp.]|uniref:dioxygenase n=1 Tax=Microbacterium sp. TaxID=51671 RepID=UPI0039E513C3
MATGGSKKSARTERERARLYEARRALHEAQLRRRRRDNLVAGIAGGVLLLAIAAGQVAYYTVGPGVPTPEPTATPTPTFTAPLLDETPATETPATETPATETPATDTTPEPDPSVAP